MVKVRNSKGDGFAWGSGAIVSLDGDATYIVTAAHCTAGMGDWVAVVFSDGRTHDVAQVVAIDQRPEADTALLKLYAGPRPDGFQVAELEPVVGQFVHVAGFPEAGGIVVRETVIVRFDSDATMELRGMAIHGESGGPVIDGSGQLIGQVFATDGQTATCCRLGVVHGLIRRCFPNWQPSRQSPQLQQPPWQPMQPPLVPIVPSVAGPQPPATNDATDGLAAWQASIESDIAAIKEGLAEIGSQEPTPGPVGPPGPQGPPGEPGKGVDQGVIDGLQASIQDRLHQYGQAAVAAAVDAGKTAAAQHIASVAAPLATNGLPAWLPMIGGVTGPAGAIGSVVAVWMLRRLGKRLSNQTSGGSGGPSSDGFRRQ